MDVDRSIGHHSVEEIRKESRQREGRCWIFDGRKLQRHVVPVGNEENGRIEGAIRAPQSNQKIAEQLKCTADEDVRTNDVREAHRREWVAIAEVVRLADGFLVAVVLVVEIARELRLAGDEHVWPSQPIGEDDRVDLLLVEAAEHIGL